MKVVFPPQHLRKALIPVGPLMGLATVAGPAPARHAAHGPPAGRARPSVRGWQTVARAASATP
jgi:hypothetical protein